MLVSLSQLKSKSRASKWIWLSGLSDFLIENGFLMVQLPRASRAVSYWEQIFVQLVCLISNMWIHESPNLKYFEKFGG